MAQGYLRSGATAAEADASRLFQTLARRVVDDLELDGVRVRREQRYVGLGTSLGRTIWAISYKAYIE